MAVSQWFFPFDTKKYRQQALKKYPDSMELAMDYYYELVLRSKEFHQSYPGIFGSKGQLIMDPGQYDELVRNAQNYASKKGFTLSRTQVGTLVGRGDRIEDFAYRVDVASQIRANKQLLTAVQEVTGHKIKNAQDAFNFLSGKTDPQVYAAYTQAEMLAAGRSAGLLVNKREVASLAAGVTEQLSFADVEAKFKDIADQLRSAGPELRSFGISQRDLETIQFGGSNRAQLAQRAEQALKQRQAALSATPATEQVGLVGTRPVTPGYNEPGL